MLLPGFSGSRQPSFPNGADSMFSLPGPGLGRLLAPMLMQVKSDSLLRGRAGSPN